MLLFLYFILPPQHFLYDICLVDFIKWWEVQFVCLAGCMIASDFVSPYSESLTSEINPSLDGQEEASKVCEVFTERSVLLYSYIHKVTHSSSHSSD
jgi:hypothetical protein